MRDSKYKDILMNSPMGYAYHKIICDKNGIPIDYEFIEVNTEFERITGLASSKIIGRAITEVLPEIKNGNFDWIDEYGDIALFGGEKEFDSYSEPLNRHYKVKAYSNEEGYFTTLFYDITDLIQNNIELENNKKKLEKYIDQAPYGIFISDENGHYVEVNLHACTMTGYSKEELIGKNLMDLIPEEDKQKANESFSDTKINGQCVTEIKFIKKSGEKRYWRIKAVKLSDNRLIGFTEDISGQKELENQINYKQELMNLYQDTANIMFLVLGRDGSIDSINKEGCRVLGLSKQEILGKNWFDNFINEKTREEVKEVFEKVIIGETDNVKFHENKIITSTGEERIISWHNTILKDEEQNVVSILSAGNDVTERRKAEQSLKESEEKFRYIFDNSAIGKSLTLASGELQVNNTFCNMLQYTKEELENKKWQDITHPDDIDLSQREINKLLDRKVDKVDFEKRYLKKDGSTMWANVHSSIRNDEKGNFLYFITSIIDTTDKKIFEQTILESEAKYKALFEYSGVALGYYKPDGTIISLNRKALENMGGKAGDFIGKSIYELLPPDNKGLYKDRIKLASLTDEPLTYISQIPISEGLKWFSSTYRRVVDDNGNLLGIQISSIGITKRKEAEDESKRAQSFLQAAFDHSQAGIAIADVPDGKLRYVNKAGLMIRNQSEEELVKNIDYHKYVESWNILHFDGTEYKDEEVPLARAVLFGEKITEEFIIRRDNFEDRVVLANSRPYNR